jgi:uncharacterized protein YyaL (SSP411 family)
MTNRLAHETSPYLLQHADNPVEWYPWGEEALGRARRENRPILLSIGYAACHWCHVMAHESFEDPDTAALMNQHFVNIKVDREERPDLDSIYMNATVAMTGQGGWPMTVFLTPDGAPFFAGTYFPRFPRYGMPSFRQLLTSIARTWETQQEEAIKHGREVSQVLGQGLTLEGQEGSLDERLLQQALSSIERAFDPGKGGFGRAPKFPQPMTIEFLLRLHLRDGNQQALHMAEHTLEMMARGGMYDQLGGGFARYSTDNDWLVPHFEKMLYDNALLTRAYLHAWQLTGRPLYRRIVEETLDFVLRDMRHDTGGFYSSYDADSEGEEGKFYVWTADEIRQHLGGEVDAFLAYYDVTPGGNWESHTILNVVGDVDDADRFAAARQKLLAIREKRIWPGLDDKVLTAWNGLMLAVFAEAGRALNRPDYTQAAVQNAEFLYNHLRQENGRLLRTWKAGSEGKYNAYLEDYAYLADGLLALYQTTFDLRWYTWAYELAETMLAHFYDGENGGFYDTSDDHEALIHRPKDVQDNATPSGNAMAAHVLLQLSLYTGNGRYWDVAEQATSALYQAMAQYATGFAQWLNAAALILGEPREIAIAGDPAAPDTQALLDVAFAGYRPNQVIAVGLPTSDAARLIPLLDERPMRDNKATAYVCRRFACQTPVTEPAALAAQL